MSEVNAQINQCLQLLQDLLSDDLLGVYLYGSAVVGGLQKYSDVDLLVVSNRNTTQEEKKQLISSLLDISGIYMKDTKPPLELTIVVKSDVNPWHYPTLFDFQYGEWLRETFEGGNIAPWQSYEMPDLAIINTQVLLKSKTIFGAQANELLAPVPYRDFIIAMLHDLERLIADIQDDTRNVLLTLARIWSTVETSQIRSKPAAADWALIRLPQKLQPVMERAKLICTGFELEHWNDIKDQVQPCAIFITKKINTQKSLINVDDPNNAIELLD